MQKKIILLLFLLLLSLHSLFAFTLPKGSKWETGVLATDFASKQATKGGQLNASIATYPLTFRLYGPHATSGEFALINSELSVFSLVERHPVTRKYMPMLALAWAIGKDRKTIYFKLDPKATWSDGKPITSEDYVFAWQFLRSSYIESPYLKQYFKEHIKSVQAISKYIIKITTVKASWRLLFETNISPVPKHSTNLTKNWVRTANWKPNVVASPYVLSHFQRGRSVSFSRVKHWWGEKEKRFQSRFNFDTIHLQVVRNENTAYALFKKGKLDIYPVTHITLWNRQTTTPAITKGYINKQAILLNRPSGPNGIFFNLNDPILKDKKVRKALAHIFDYKTMRKNFLYNSTMRQTNFFDVPPPYYKKNQTVWEYSVKKANQLLDQAKWTGKRTRNAIRTKNGRPLQITISFGAQVWMKYLVFFQENAKKAGVDIQLKLLDGAALFKAVSEKNYQAITLIFSAFTLPAPKQFLDSRNAIKNTNNIFMLRDKSVDALIQTYETSLSEKKRVQAIFSLEDKIKEKALLIPFWKSDRVRLLWWRYIKGPKEFVTADGTDWQFLWYDKAEKQKLEQAQRNNKKFDLLKPIANPYHVKIK